MDRNELKVEADLEPTVEAVDTEEVNLNVFFKWDALSRRLAASGQMNPPWFRPVGLDDGELLLFSPVPSKCPDGMEADVHAETRWTMDGAQVAKIIGPTKGLIDKYLACSEQKGNKEDEVAVKLVAECLMELPETFKLRRPFMIGEVVVLAAGDAYPAPWKLAEDPVEGIRKDELIRAYVNDCLPKRIRDMVHTGALCMAIPETDFMVSAGHEKGTEVDAKMRSESRAAGAADDRDFGEGSSGDWEKK